MWKSLVLMLLSIPLSLIMLVVFWAESGWRSGVIAAGSTVAVCLVGSTVMLFFIRKLSLVDVFLPTIFAVVWSAMLSVVTIGADLFTAPAAIGSGVVLSLCLWRVYHNKGVGKQWLILPVIVYVYEMLPVNIPGPFDDYFSFGGDVIYAILFYMTASLKRELPAAWQPTEPPTLARGRDERRR